MRRTGEAWFAVAGEPALDEKLEQAAPPREINALYLLMMEGTKKIGRCQTWSV
jgi:hypothetical protein